MNMGPGVLWTWDGAHTLLLAKDKFASVSLDTFQHYPLPGWPKFLCMFWEETVRTNVQNGESNHVSCVKWTAGIIYVIKLITLPVSWRHENLLCQSRKLQLLSLKLAVDLIEIAYQMVKQLWKWSMMVDFLPCSQELPSYKNIISIVVLKWRSSSVTQTLRCHYALN